MRGPVTLFHGSSATNRASILEDGLTAPSYWGTEAEASGYADGLMIAIDIGEFDLDAVSPNDLLIDSLREQDPDDEGVAEWDSSAKSWQDSLRIFGSIRYDRTLQIDEQAVLDLSPEISPR